MVLVLDLDRTLNCLYPHWVRSVRELAPAELVGENGPRLWAWLAEHLSTVEYPVNQPAAGVIAELSRDADAVIVNTGRPEGARPATERWLAHRFKVDLTLMRAPNDFRSTAEVKRDNLVRHILPICAERKVFAFDDNLAALRMYRDTGITAFKAPACWKYLSAAFRRGSRLSASHTLLAYAARTSTFD